MVLGEAAAAAAVAGGGLFEYNRQNFMYDRKLRQETEYQIMDFRIKQAELWREDVRDIVGLTSVKMDTYLIVNAVQLGFCVMAFCEGRLAAGTPTWLIGCHTLSLAGSFMYLLMSVWLAMHASVTAKSYEVRLLTQLVRLPVPSWAQLEGARTYSSGFEKVEPKQMFRVPFVMGSQESVLQSSAPEPAAGASPLGALDDHSPSVGGGQGGSGSLGHGPGVSEADLEAGDGAAPRTSDVWGLEGRGDGLCELDGRLRADPRKQRHLRLVRHAMQYWQSYDGFARVALSCGTNQLVTALAYYVIGYVLISNHAVIACWLVVILFMVIAAALIRLDMSLTGLEYRISVLLVVSGPCLTAVAAEQWSRHTPVSYEVAQLLCPISYVVHAMWLMFLLYISNVREQKGGALLPTGFRSVMYIDVFGWIKRNQKQRRFLPWDSTPPSLPAATDASTRAAGTGPAVQGVHYEQGQPVPSRPEELPGAALGPQPLEGLRREDLEPTTFVPREKEGSDFNNVTMQAHMRPGFVPWRIFCVATVLLIILWWISGVIVLLQSCGMNWLKVAPLLREPEEEHSPGSAMMLQLSSPMQALGGGTAIGTSWSFARARPQGLACSDASGVLTFASSGRFGLYAAQLEGGGSNVRFEPAAPCPPIEGEELGGLALDCGPGGPATCRALVLHHSGARLATCALSPEAGRGAASEEQVAAKVSLTERTAGSGEGAVAVALAGRCRGSSGGQCAFVETSDRRLLELRMGTKDGGSGAPDWFPTRAVVEGFGGGAAMHLVGAYLGVLRGPEQRLDVLSPESGATLGQWQLPGDQRWGAMCSTSTSVYLLTEGAAPTLWRFPMPEALRADQQQPGPRATGEQDGDMEPMGGRRAGRRAEAVLATAF